MGVFHRMRFIGYEEINENNAHKKQGQEDKLQTHWKFMKMEVFITYVNEII